MSKICLVNKIITNLDDKIIENAKKVTSNAPNLKEFFKKTK